LRLLVFFMDPCSFRTHRLLGGADAVRPGGASFPPRMLTHTVEVVYQGLVK